MTLIKSLLLGSAAGIVAIASAQAADLPTRKGAPAAEYVRICHVTVNGTPIVGFVLPGSDTCFRIGGYITAQYTLGNNAQSPYSTNPRASSQQDALGFYTRGRITFDAVSNTAAGPLHSVLAIDANYGTGFDGTTGNIPGTNDFNTHATYAFIQWAGLTAGRHASFFDFLAGGPAWDDFISPDHTGTGTNLLAYTAALGGGFSATVSMESPEQEQAGQFGVRNFGNAYGTRAPDFVLNGTYAGGWGKTQLSAVFHQNQYASLAGGGTNPITGLATWPSTDSWGWGILGGVSINLPGMAGSDFNVQGVYTEGAVAYSGWTSFGAFNYDGAGGPLGLSDINPFTGGETTAWSIASYFDFKINPQFTISPEISYGELHYPNDGPSMSAWLGGGTIAWTPVNNLVVNLDLLYIAGSNTVPAPYSPLLIVKGGNWSGFNGKLRIERDF